MHYRSPNAPRKGTLIVEPFRTLDGVAAPLLLDDVNTDQIAPATTVFSPDYAALLFARWRSDPSFVLNHERFRRARILAAGRNFGCGSSRESAVWALVAFGIRCVVARSFAEIFRDNCLKNGVLPVTLDEGDAERFEREVVADDGAASFYVDLVEQTIVAPSGTRFRFAIAEAERNALLNGLDEIGLTLQHAEEIARWEQGMDERRPWAQHLP
jgi:3-isopropylmalate dehydratase small subunit